MVARSEENKRWDFTVNSIQGWELITTKFKHRNLVLGILEVVWGWGKGYWNPEWAGNVSVMGCGCYGHNMSLLYQSQPICTLVGSETPFLTTLIDCHPSLSPIEDPFMTPEPHGILYIGTSTHLGTLPWASPCWFTSSVCMYMWRIAHQHMWGQHYDNATPSKEILQIRWAERIWHTCTLMQWLSSVKVILWLIYMQNYWG